MRALLQRVLSASVDVTGREIGNIGPGLLVFLGVKTGDDVGAAAFLAEKTLHLRIFADEEGKMNKSVVDVRGGVLIISQFTLYGDCRHGRRPSFIEAAAPETARRLYEHFIARVRLSGLSVETGEFAADMTVHLQNDGPVTLMLESPITSANGA